MVFQNVVGDCMTSSYNFEILIIYCPLINMYIK